MFGLIGRDTLPTSTLDEFEFLVTQLQAFLSVAHDESGALRTLPAVTNGVVSGAMMDYGGASDPAGGQWYLCDGRQVSRLLDQALFNVIGTTFGAGDGATTFNIPDRRGRFGLGKAAAGTGSTLGTTGGALDHTHTAGAHTHSVPGLSVPGLTVPSDTVSGSTGTGTTGGGSTGTGTTDVENGLFDIANVPGGGASTCAHGPHNHAIPALSIPGLSVPSLSVSGNTAGTTTGTGTTGTGTTGSASGADTGAANPAYLVVNVIIKR